MPLHVGGGHEEVRTLSRFRRSRCEKRNRSRSVQKLDEPHWVSWRLGR